MDGYAGSDYERIREEFFLLKQDPEDVVAAKAKPKVPWMSSKLQGQFNYPQTVVVCGNCQTVLCQPTGGKARLTKGCSFRRKGD
ncbi:hypothetical protein MKX03_031074 [Papaver bracteatum]|nr:hypothetical protein MKX03_031074 [Papaver bracteatum]